MSGELLDLRQDNTEEMEQIKANQMKAIALLQNAINPNKCGSYAANNATGMRKLVEQALEQMGSLFYLYSLDFEQVA